MVKVDRRTWKGQYFVRLEKLVQDFPKCIVVTVDNVGSKQMQQIRFVLLLSNAHYYMSIYNLPWILFFCVEDFIFAHQQFLIFI